MNDQFLCFQSNNASHRLILLHGWGADAEDLIPLGKALQEVHDKRFDLIALRAPEMHPQGFGRQWYGLFPPDWSAVPGAILSLKRRLQKIATREIPLEKTVLFGFSQGGAMALGGGCDLPLAGIIGCSAYAHPEWIPPQKRPPVFLTHGTNDDVVPLAGSEQLFESLTSSEFEVELKTFKGGHQVPNEMMPYFLHALSSWFV